MPKTEAFDRFSSEYDDWFDRNADLYRAELETIRQLMPSSGSELVEIGVGSGKFAVPLGIRMGVEPSEQMAARAEKHGITVYRGVAEMLPFEDGRFDGVLMVTTICFVDDILQSFRESLRVLKEGGFLLVGFVDRESDLGRTYSANRQKSRFYRQAVFYTASEVLRLLQDAGFTIAAVRQSLISGKPPETILDGFGRGAFVAIKGIKKTDQVDDAQASRSAVKPANPAP